MADKSKLNDMVDKLIDQRPEDAQIDFHDYIKSKMEDVMGAESGETESNNTDKED